MDCFDSLPLAAVVSSAHGRFFCVHGGLRCVVFFDLFVPFFGAEERN